MQHSLFKRSLLTAAIAAFALCPACHTAQNAPDPSAPATPTIPTTPIRPLSPSDDFSPFNPFDPIELLGETTPSVWDVSDIDISEIDLTRKLIAFTFDDAPSKTLENILAVFTAFNESNPDCKATATVFCNGHLMDNTSTHTLRTAYALGFELGNHTFSHVDLTALSPSKLREEIDSTDKLLSAVDGKARHLFRAPFGKINDEVKAAITTPAFNWTIDTLDWRGIPAKKIYDAVWSNKFSGAIVLMHDGYENTVTALKRLLPDLKADGYQVVGISAMAKAHSCPLRCGSLYIRARKNGTSA